MKDKSLICDAETVRAIEAGATEFRVVMKPQPEFNQVHVWRGKTIHDSSNRSWCFKDKNLGRCCSLSVGSGEDLIPYTPYQVGQRIYVERKDVSPGYKAGRLANGAERGKGKIVHLVKGWKSLCGTSPGRRSGGWLPFDLADEPDLKPTCGKCIKKGLIWLEIVGVRVEKRDKWDWVNTFRRIEG